ncbi:MAG TPA: hypothetical protein VGQ31_08490 [Candidatus Limnocylindrales bacterium]|nr:hypothetical protein [Candidatus Limnocylindrales bacterium]
MDHRAVHPPRRHWSLVALVIATIAVAVFYTVVNGLDVPGILAVLSFTSVGALIADRRPAERVGWVCLGIGTVSGLGLLFRSIAIVIDRAPGQLPLAGAACAVLADLLTSLAILVSGPLLISRFPHRAAAAWQRRLEDVLLVFITFVAMADAVRPGPLDYGWVEPIENPFAIDWIPTSSQDAFAWIFLSYAAAYLVTTIGLVVRYRRGGSVVRAQVRWFAAAIGASLGLLVLLFATTGNEVLNDLVWAAWIASLLLPPIAVAIAILRYRLYDIDRIVSKTIGYALITVILFTVFATANIVLVSTVSPLVEDQSIAVAASTLLVAVLFDPLRKRVQRAVDRRFHRAHYDAQRTVAGFADRLRNELDLPTLTLELTAVADRAVKPTTTSLWLRGGGQS